MDFKDHFDQALCQELGQRAAVLAPGFDAQRYQAALPTELQGLEMKARVRALAEALWHGLGLSFDEAMPVLTGMLDAVPQARLGRMSGFQVWVIADIVETRGLDDFELAMQAIHKVTRHFTSEFAIRPYLVAYPQQTLAVLTGWLDDDSSDVRRLISEGTRPRLPWASRVPSLLLDPTPILPLLERLRDDPSLYVRRSVANNLNDISKDHPALVVELLSRWKAELPSEQGQWMVRHAARTLTRQGNAAALELLGYLRTTPVKVKRFEVSPPSIVAGQSITLDCDIQVEGAGEHGLMVDYAILAPGARGQTNRRVFKWSKRKKQAQGSVRLQREHGIATNQVRSYYPGAHQIQLIVNGQVLAEGTFELGT